MGARQELRMLAASAIGGDRFAAWLGDQVIRCVGTGRPGRKLCV